MKGKQIIIALAVLAVLGAYLYFGEIKKKESEDREKSEKEAIWPGIVFEQVAEAIITNKETGKIAVKRSGTGWLIEKPKKVDGNKPVLDNVIGGFFRHKIIRKIEQADFSDYNIGKTETTITLVTADDKRLKILFGDTNPTGSYAYAGIEGDTQTAYMLDASLKTNCEKKFFEMRFTGIVKLDENLVEKVRVNFKDKKYTLEKKDGLWKITSPFKSFAKKERAVSLINIVKKRQGKRDTEKLRGKGR